MPQGSHERAGGRYDADPGRSHQARIFVTDAAGNRGAGPPFDLTTRNQSAPNGANASRSATLRAWFGSRRTRRSATLSYRGTRVITGDLKSSAGEPIAGAVIDVYARHMRTGATERSAGQATTDANGHFTYRTKGGPSRSLSFGYRAFSLDDAYAVADRVQLHVRPRITLRATPRSVRNGSRVTFPGRLVGGPGRENVAVVIYALSGRGTRSRIPVEAARTDRAGVHTPVPVPHRDPSDDLQVPGADPAAVRLSLHERYLETDQCDRPGLTCRPACAGSRARG